MDTFDKDVLEPIRLDEGEDEQFDIPSVDEEEEEKKKDLDEEEEPEFGGIDDPDNEGLLDEDFGEEEEF